MLQYFDCANIMSFSGGSSKLNAVGNGNSSVTAICGKPGSGKSNMFYAFKKGVNYVLNSVAYADNPEAHTPIPSVFSSKEASKEFKFMFQFNKYNMPGAPNDGLTYKYTFTIGLDGSVLDERLETVSAPPDYTAGKEEVLFYRRRDGGMGFNKIPKEYVKVLKMALDRNSLIVSLGACIRVDLCKTIKEWFNAVEMVDVSRDLPTTGIVHADVLPANFISDEDVQNDVIWYLNYCGYKVAGFNIKNLSGATINPDPEYQIDILYHRKDYAKPTKIYLGNESDAFKALFFLYPYIRRAKNRGGLLFVDNLDANVGKDSTKKLISLFRDTYHNESRGQLIFTTREPYEVVVETYCPNIINVIEKDTEWVLDGSSWIGSDEGKVIHEKEPKPKTKGRPRGRKKKENKTMVEGE